MQTTAALVFVLTYVLISTRRLRLLPIGRPAGALTGAVLMVVLGVLSPEAAWSAIDGDTIILLFSLMVLTGYLAGDGLFAWVSALVLRRCQSPHALLLLLSGASAGLSALWMNDTVCLFLTPVVVAICRQRGLPLAPYLIALATSANVGSAATLVGNPQNMLIGTMSGISFARFLWLSLPAAVVGFVINYGFLVLYYGRRLRQQASAAAAAAEPSTPIGPYLRLDLVIVLAILVGYFAGIHLGLTTLSGVLVRLLAERRDPQAVFNRVDWTLLLFFSGLFIVVAGLVAVGWVDVLWGAAGHWVHTRDGAGFATFSAFMVAGSNLVSNVPMVLVSGPHLAAIDASELTWALMGWTTTAAGNLTLIGSVANIIVAESAREHYDLGYFEYLRFGLVATPVVVAGGVVALMLVHWI